MNVELPYVKMFAIHVDFSELITAFHCKENHDQTYRVQTRLCKFIIFLKKNVSRKITVFTRRVLIRARLHIIRKLSGLEFSSGRVSRPEASIQGRTCAGISLVICQACCFCHRDLITPRIESFLCEPKLSYQGEATWLLGASKTVYLFNCL